jgi:hypothetical protein
MEASDVVREIEANLIPGAVVVPSMVAEVSRAHAVGFSLVFVPAFRP